MAHVELITSLLRSVRARGAAATLDELRASRPAIRGGEYHDTAAVFYVWAVDRLVRGGLSDVGVLWHPLVQADAVLTWWPADVLDRIEARAWFTPSTLAAPGEPQPIEPQFLVAA